MNKRNKLILLLIVFFSVFLAGCNKDNNDNKPKEEEKENNIQLYKATYQDEYFLDIGDTFNPFLTEYTTGDLTFESSDPEIVSVDEEGNICANALGDVVISMFEDGRYFGSGVFHVINRYDLQYNVTNSLMNELKEKLDAYDSYNYFTFTSHDLSDGKDSSFKLKKSPFYYETNTSSEHKVVKEKSGKYYNLDIKDDRKYIELTATTKEDIENEYKSTVEELINVDSNEIERKYELKKKGDTYTLRFMLIDSNYFYHELIENTFYTTQVEILKNAIMEIQFKLFESKVEVSFTVYIHYITKNIVIDATVVGNMTFDFNNFDEFNDEGYKYSKPLKMEDAYDFGPLNTIPKYGSGYHYGYLEKGTYTCVNDDTNSYIKNGILKLYDSTGQEIVPTCFTDSYLFLTIDVPKDDYYYLLLSGLGASNNHGHLEKITTSHDSKPLASDTGHIENRYDYLEYTYNSLDENEVIKITNNKDYPVYFYTDYIKQFVIADSASFYYTIEGHQDFYINPNDGEYKLYLISSLKDQSNVDLDYSYDFDITVEVLKNDNGTDLENLDLVTEEYGKEYFTGLGLDERCLLLKAEKTGVYSFDCDALVSIDRHDPHKPGFYLEEGEYIVKLTKHYTMFTITKIKYHYIDSSDKDVDVIIPKNGDPSLKVQNVVESQVIKYHFTFDEDTIISYPIEQLKIYDFEDNQVEIPKFPASAFSDFYILTKLKKGDYYFVLTKNINYDSNISIRVYEGEFEYFDIDSTNTIDFGYEYSYQTNNAYFAYYRVYEANADCDLVFDGSVYDTKVYVFDESLEKVSFSSSDRNQRIIHLEEGKKYYIIIKISGINSSITVSKK